MQVEPRHVTGGALGYGLWVVYSQILPFYGWQTPPLEGPDFLAVIAVPWLLVVGAANALDRWRSRS